MTETVLPFDTRPGRRGTASWVSHGDTDKGAPGSPPLEQGKSSLIDRLEQALAHAALFGTDIEGAPKLGRFIVLRRLSVGGMSVIYEGYDPKLDRKVAVKLMRASLGDSSTGRRPASYGKPKRSPS